MSRINFFKEDINLDLRTLRKLKSWVKLVADLHKQPIDTLNYIFCSDEFLHQINLEYLNHDTYTDIVTFDLRADNSSEALEADIFISVERVEENAQKMHTSLIKELARVMIHGVLHLIGYADKTTKEKELMRSKENEALQYLKE
jgi:probable rRNA maturation factor